MDDDSSVPEQIEAMIGVLEYQVDTFLSDIRQPTEYDLKILNDLQLGLDWLKERLREEKQYPGLEYDR